MPVLEINNYLQKVLNPMLIEFGVSEKFIEYLCGVVETQMLSALLHWEDDAFRKALLFIALEEASFYGPGKRTDVKCFVVQTLRNSPFESLQSNCYAQCGLSEQITDAQIKALTSAAIKYFNSMDFLQLSIEVREETDVFDFYGQLAERYPVSWKALTYLASSVDKPVTYTRAEVKKPLYLKDIAFILQKDTPKNEVVLDGYSTEIDPLLAQRLIETTESGSPGYLAIDCFKMLTRNIEKLLRVMEFLLTRGYALVTANCYIENGYVERRKNVLRAASCKNAMADMKRHFSMTKGLGPKFKRALEGVTGI